jgi:uncharacterized protein YbcI
MTVSTNHQPDGQGLEVPLSDPTTRKIGNAIVRIQRDYLGRGPQTARTTIRDGLVTVLLEDTLTKAERSLVDDGQTELVLEFRRACLQTMRRAMVAAVEECTQQRVVAFMSTNNVEPDVACELFLLESHRGPATMLPTDGSIGSGETTTSSGL